MSKLVPIITGVTGATIIGVGGGYLLSTQNTKIKDTFKHSLIRLDNSEETLLKTKLSKLKTGDILSGNKKLKEAKDKENKEVNSGLAELKQACQEIYESNFTDKNSNTFKDFQAYCARTIKDKVTTEQWASSSANWEGRLSKLKKNTPKALSESLIRIANQADAGKEKLQQWCTNAGNLIFEGENNLDFKDAQTYCGKED